MNKQEKILSVFGFVSNALKVASLVSFLVTLTPFVGVTVFGFKDLVFVGTVSFYAATLFGLLMMQKPSFLSEETEWANFLFYLGCYFGLFTVTFPYTQIDSFYYFWAVILLHVVYSLLTSGSLKACWNAEFMTLPVVDKKSSRTEPQEPMKNEMYYKFNLAVSWMVRISFAVFFFWFNFQKDIPMPDVSPALIATGFLVGEFTATLGKSLSLNIDQPLKWAIHLLLMGAYTAYPLCSIVVTELLRTDDEPPVGSNMSLLHGLVGAFLYTLVTVNIALAFTTLNIHQSSPRF